MKEIINLIKDLETLLRERNDYRKSRAEALLIAISLQTGKPLNGWASKNAEESLIDESRVGTGVINLERCVVVLEPNESESQKSRFVKLTADNFYLVPEKIRNHFKS